jgi:PAS domain S-box-containing protein
MGPVVLIDKSKSFTDERFGNWSLLFENSTLGVAITNSAFRFLRANRAFLMMLECTSKELRQLSFLDICIAEDREERRGPLRELRDGARFQYEIETRYRRKDGTSLPVSAYFSAIRRIAPAQPAFLLVTADITARRAADDALRAAQSELTRVARLTTVGAMAASIAHEINQPLASIVMNGNAGLRWLSRSEPNLEEARSAVGRIVKDAHRAAQIITGIRAMFRKESTERSDVAINELICDVIATSLGELKSRRISLALELVNDLSPVPADRVQLQQVLANLVTNAIDSMASVPERPHILTVRSESLDEWVLISVQDSGTGIAPEQAERMFEAFYTTKANGIGLGLSISRSIVESHGGRLSVLPVRLSVSGDATYRPLDAVISRAPQMAVLRKMMKRGHNCSDCSLRSLSRRSNSTRSSSRALRRKSSPLPQ